MRRSTALATWLAATLASTLAWADPPSAQSCADAYTQAQTLRNARKLVQARDALRTCAQSTCKDFIMKDCTEWLDQVQESLPSVVPIATDAEGNTLFDVKVSMDGKPFVEKVDGRSVDVDPGVHTFAFEAADGTRAEKQVLVAESEKSKRVAVTLGKAAAPAAGAAPPAASAGAAVGAPAGALAPAPAESPSSIPWATVGLVTAGAGVVGLGVGSILALDAIGKKNAAHCTPSSVCANDADAAKLRQAGAAANGATVAFVAGGVLAAAGVTMWVLAPSRRVQAVPSVGANTAGVVIQGLW